MSERCYLFENGKCNKYHREKKCCGGMQTDWFDEEFTRTNDPMKACEQQSIFGNDYFKLTDEDIDALKRGEILYYVGEYGIFIRYEGRREEGERTRHEKVLPMGT